MIQNLKRRIQTESEKLAVQIEQMKQPVFEDIQNHLKGLIYFKEKITQEIKAESCYLDRLPPNHGNSHRFFSFWKKKEDAVGDNNIQINWEHWNKIWLNEFDFNNNIKEFEKKRDTRLDALKKIVDEQKNISGRTIKACEVMYQEKVKDLNKQFEQAKEKFKDFIPFSNNQILLESRWVNVWDDEMQNWLSAFLLPTFLIIFSLLAYFLFYLEMVYEFIAFFPVFWIGYVVLLIFRWGFSTGLSIFLRAREKKIINDLMKKGYSSKRLSELAAELENTLKGLSLQFDKVLDK